MRRAQLGQSYSLYCLLPGSYLSRDNARRTFTIRCMMRVTTPYLTGNHSVQQFSIILSVLSKSAVCRQGHRTEQAVGTPGEQCEKGHREADTEDAGAIRALEKSTHKICDLMKGQIKHVCHARGIMSGNFIRQQTRKDRKVSKGLDSLLQTKLADFK